MHGTVKTGGGSPTEDFDALVARTVGLQPWRRVFHAANGLALAFAPGWLGLRPATVALLLGLAFTALLLADLVRLRSRTLNVLFFRAFSRLASPREEGRIASSTWFAFGAFLAWALYPPEAARASMVLLALADPAASVIGRLYGRRPLGKGTLVGSTTFLLVGTLALWPLVGPGPAILAAAVGAVAEVGRWGVDDNLLIPLVGGAVLALVGGGPG